MAKGPDNVKETANEGSNSPIISYQKYEFLSIASRYDHISAQTVYSLSFSLILNKISFFLTVDDSSLSHKYFNVNKLDPSKAQISTLPHYTDPHLNLGKTEKQMSYSNPYRAQDFYFEEHNTVKKPIVQHLERSFIN